MIHYHCRHCEIELGTLPLKLAKKVLPFITKIEDEEEGERFLTYEEDGSLTVHTICEQCEQTLQQSPHYYVLEKWLQ